MGHNKCHTKFETRKVIFFIAVGSEFALILKEWKCVKAANFTQCLCVVNVLFNTSLYKYLLSTYTFPKLAFCLSAFFVFSVLF